MSQVKDLIVEDERQYSAAIRVGLAAGELNRCDLICEELTERHSKDALDLAVATGLSAYDASYVALAMRIDKIFITADGKLFQKLAGTPSANQVRLLAEPVH